MGLLCAVAGGLIKPSQSSPANWRKPRISELAKAVMHSIALALAIGTLDAIAIAIIDTEQGYQSQAAEEIIVTLAYAIQEFAFIGLAVAQVIIIATPIVRAFSPFDLSHRTPLDSFRSDLGDGLLAGASGLGMGLLFMVVNQTSATLDPPVDFWGTLGLSVSYGSAIGLSIFFWFL